MATFLDDFDIQIIYGNILEENVRFQQHNIIQVKQQGIENILLDSFNIDTGQEVYQFFVSK